MKYAAITSMDPKYYWHCGKSRMYSYKKHWHGLFPLYLYNENDFFHKVKTIRNMGWDLGEEYEKFQERHSDNDKITTFAKKGFSIIHAMENLDCEKLIWIDADVIIQSAPPMMFFDLIAPDDVLSTHFSVWHKWPSEEDPNRMVHSCETGFFILNKKHPQFEEFMSTYKDIYVNDKSSDLRRFYDGEVYGKTVEIMEAKGAKMMNLNPGWHKTPIPRSVMAPYIKHFKAGLKDSVNFDDLVDED